MPLAGSDRLGRIQRVLLQRRRRADQQPGPVGTGPLPRAGTGRPGWPQDGYRGDYITELAQAYLRGDKVDAEDQHVTGCGDADDLEAIRQFAVAYLRREQDLDLKAFAVHFDVYFLESSLYRSGAVEATVQRLIEQGHTYEHEGACGCAPPTSATTRTGSCAKAMAAIPISCRMWPIT